MRQEQRVERRIVCIAAHRFYPPESVIDVYVRHMRLPGKQQNHKEQGEPR